MTRPIVLPQLAIEDLPEFVGTCDAGDCNRITAALVWTRDANDKPVWLSVCRRHAAEWAEDDDRDEPCPECPDGEVVSVGRPEYETGHQPYACNAGCGYRG